MEDPTPPELPDVLWIFWGAHTATWRTSPDRKNKSMVAYVPESSLADALDALGDMLAIADDLSPERGEAQEAYDRLRERVKGTA